MPARATCLRTLVLGQTPAALHSKPLSGLSCLPPLHTSWPDPPPTAHAPQAPDDPPAHYSYAPTYTPPLRQPAAVERTVNSPTDKNRHHSNHIALSTVHSAAFLTAPQSQRHQTTTSCHIQVAHTAHPHSQM